MGGLQRSPKFPFVISLAWIDRGILGQKSFRPPKSFSNRFTYEHDFYSPILLSSSLILRNVLRLMIFNNLKSISLVDQIFGNLGYICIYIYIYIKIDR